VQYEAVPESLKNVLLVMSASGFLLPPHDERTEEQAILWDATFERIQPFLPDLKGESLPTTSDFSLTIRADDLFPPPPVVVPFDSPPKPAVAPLVPEVVAATPVLEGEVPVSEVVRNK
jgi:brefeldin A-resistance guanine nucleotide exchange factor 1